MTMDATVSNPRTLSSIPGRAARAVGRLGPRLDGHLELHYSSSYTWTP